MRRGVANFQKKTGKVLYKISNLSAFSWKMLTSQFNFHFTIEEFPQSFSMNELGQLTPVTCGVNQRKTSLLQYDIEVCILTS